MSGDLELNKILGAGLATALVFLGVREVSIHMFEHEPPEHPGYAIAVPEETSGGGPAAPVLPPDWGTVLKTADLTAGQGVFAKCQSCHNDAAGAPAKIGPNLYGVVGRPIATFPGFAYSDAMKAHAAKEKVWGYDQLFVYLNNPQSVVPGTKMTFVGDPSPTDRVNLIAWLRSQGSTGYAIPAPDPKRQPAAAAPAGAKGVTTAPSTATGQASQGAPLQQTSPTAQSGGGPGTGAKPSEKPKK
ncbi:MAG TPA: cytochrome c family protein [Caulobacteraceae bacterium]|jgi:cytochrome c|nr:cytochrome c family protein [Caulobacteraceae bacterium]